MRDAVQQVTGHIPPHAAPLLEEKRHARHRAVVAEIANPWYFYGLQYPHLGAVAPILCQAAIVCILLIVQVGAAFTSDDHPMDPGQAFRGQANGLKNRLDGQEPNASWYLLQDRDTLRCALSVLNGDAEPEIVRARIGGEKLNSPRRSLGQGLERGRAASDLREDGFTVAVRYPAVEQVAHRVYEYEFASLEPPCLFEFVSAQGDIEAIRECPRSSFVLGDDVGIAAGASGANLGATTDGVPCFLGPLDGSRLHGLDIYRDTDPHLGLGGISASPARCSQCELVVVGHRLVVFHGGPIVARSGADGEARAPFNAAGYGLNGGFMLMADGVGGKIQIRCLAAPGRELDAIAHGVLLVCKYHGSRKPKQSNKLEGVQKIIMLVKNIHAANMGLFSGIRR